MLHKKTQKEPGNATRASVTKEMAKPCMARSARIAELNLDTARIREQPSTTMPGTVDKIIPSPRPSEPEKIQIAVHGADHRHRDVAIGPNRQNLIELGAQVETDAELVGGLNPIQAKLFVS